MKRLRKAIAATVGLCFSFGYIFMKGEKMWDAKSVTIGIMWGFIITLMILRNPGRPTRRVNLIVNTVFIAVLNGVSALMLPPGDFIRLLAWSILLVALSFAHAWAYQKEQEIFKNAAGITDS